LTPIRPTEFANDAFLLRVDFFGHGHFVARTTTGATFIVERISSHAGLIAIPEKRIARVFPEDRFVNLYVTAPIL